MAKVRLFNTRGVGQPSIILPIPGQSEVVIPAEGDPDKDGDELIEGAKGVLVEADLERLQRQATQVRGLKVRG
jgi:hypothetical protein